jgi:hypothetical protein
MAFVNLLVNVICDFLIWGCLLSYEISFLLFWLRDIHNANKLLMESHIMCLGIS